ncbi:MAG: hypothetical protein FWG88_02090 [Oscillospiraceae bacterium]|nr:hypothetical protein [Oscillospiraceae bacterium]
MERDSSENVISEVETAHEASCHCHKCGQVLSLSDRVCTACGVMTHIVCPYCGKETFIQSNCRNCRNSLFVACQKKGCGAVQLVSHLGICKACGATMDLIPNESKKAAMQK